MRLLETHNYPPTDEIGCRRDRHESAEADNPSAEQNGPVLSRHIRVAQFQNDKKPGGISSTGFAWVRTLFDQNA
jgi:hypothetical protein